MPTSSFLHHRRGTTMLLLGAPAATQPEPFSPISLDKPAVSAVLETQHESFVLSCVNFEEERACSGCTILKLSYNDDECKWSDNAVLSMVIESPKMHANCLFACRRNTPPSHIHFKNAKYVTRTCFQQLLA
jgi:hypothetical protein